MTDATTDVVLYDVQNRVATLTLNRPHRLNAWTADLEERYFDGLARAGEDPEVRVIVVTGAGRGFCAGADMDVLQGLAPAAGLMAPRRPQTFPLSIPKPVLAAVNGACAGIGLVHALMADLRFAAAGAKFTTAFVRRGLIAEHGISWTLPRLIGTSRALDLLLSGRVFLAEEALELGLVNRVVPGDALLAETQAYARELATQCSPTSLAVIKRQVYAAAQTDLEAALAEANERMRESFGRPDFREGVQSFVERRPPAFPPLDPKALS